jgi:iron complex outermembrane receptor protein
LGQNATLFYGGEGFHESVSSNNLGDHGRSRVAVYADYDMRGWKRYSFSLGAREEVVSSTHAEFSPTVAAGVWLRAGWKLMASASRAFRLPTYTDLSYHDPATLGNPNLQPEAAWSYEGGLPWDKGGRYKAEVTVFERHEKNDIDYIRSSLSDPWHAANIQSLNFTGIETSVQMSLPHRQNVGLAYTGCTDHRTC